MAWRRPNRSIETNNYQKQTSPVEVQNTQNQPSWNINAILQRLEQLESENKQFKKQIAEAKWDISENVKESKRRYGYEMDWVTRRKDELFKYRYNCINVQNDNDTVEEKAVVETITVWRPLNVRNENTWKWTNEHNISITFHDGTKTKMDILDYMNQKFQYEEFVADEDIVIKDGKKHYTFRTEKFWTFTVKENFIN